MEPGDHFCANCGAALTSGCTACGETLAADEEFCASCGTPRASAATVEHRLITAVYVDLVGSTALAELLDAESFSAVIGAVHEAVQREVSERGGSVGAFVGDGVLGVFGLPRAHEDDPERALHAATAIVGSAADLNRSLGNRVDADIAVRIGVSTGDLLAPVADDVDLGMLAGDVLNVAARLQEVAHPGTIVVAERTARSAPHFRFDDLGLKDIRGRAAPIHVFTVAGKSEIAATRLRAPLQGREREVKALRDSYRRVVAGGRPHLVTVLGAGGVGKSRLVREFMDWASSTDSALTTLTGRCLPYGEDITYRPLAEVLADLTGVTATTAPDVATERITALVERLLPDQEADIATDALMRMIGLDPSGAGDEPNPRRVREVLRTTWTTLLSGLAAGGPVVLLVEDVHWAGEALRDLLESVVKRGEGPLLVVAPARPELSTIAPDWGIAAGSATAIALGPLAEEQASRLAVHLLAGAGIPIAASDRITDRADGNPFFIEELVRQLVLRRDDDSHDGDGADELPATIQGVISARLDLLQPEERWVLQAASVVGRIFWRSALAAMTGTDPEAVAAALDRLEALQLVRTNLGSAGRSDAEYIFEHVLIRETAYGRLSRPDLARMHGALAEWLEGRARERPEAAERLAFHTFRAHEAATGSSEIPETEVARLRRLAVERLIESARRARQRAAFGRSREIAAAAMAIAAGSFETALAQEQLGLTYLAEFDGDAAWDALRTAVDLHMRAEQVDSERVATIAACAVETPLRWRGTISLLPPMEDILRYVNIGLEHAGTGDSDSFASLLTALAFVPITPGRQGAEARKTFSVDEGRAAGLQARKMARRLGQPHLESAALDALQSHALWGGRIQEAAEINAERLGIVDVVSDPWEVGDTYAMAAWLLFDLGEYVAARDRALHGYRRTIDEAPSVALHTLTWATLARVQTGEWDAVARGLTLAHELLDPDRRTRPPLYATPLFAAAAMVAEFRGRTDEADRLLAVLTDVWSGSDYAGRGGHPHSRWTRHTGPIYLHRGDLETAIQLVQGSDAEPIGRAADRVAVECDLVATRRAWDEADAVAAEARAIATAYGLAHVHAHADRLEGRASLAGGDRRGGLALLEAAGEAFSKLGDRWEASRTGLEVAAAGGTDDVESLHTFFAGIGAVDETAEAAALRDRTPPKS